MNNEDHLTQKIQERVLERIREGRLYVRPRAYFLARLIATIAISILALAVSAFILSFIVFSIHESGEVFLLRLGTPGITTFLALFPWLLLCFDIALLLALQWLLQGFKIGYRISLFSVFAAVLSVSACLAAIVGLSPLHSTLLNRADRGMAPLIGGMYGGIRSSHREYGVVRGTIRKIAGREIMISHDDLDHDSDDGTWTVELPENTLMDLQIGDRVYVFGSSTGQVIRAYGVRKLTPDQ